jgi:hypothetical protein
MSHAEFKKNWQTFSELTEQLSSSKSEQNNALVKRYIEQNMMILNDILTTSIDNLKRLEKAKTANDIICTQARLTNEMTQKLSLSAQRFLNASLGHISDYNAWLKEHCDLTD